MKNIEKTYWIFGKIYLKNIYLFIFEALNKKTKKLYFLFPYLLGKDY